MSVAAGVVAIMVVRHFTRPRLDDRQRLAAAVQNIATAVTRGRASSVSRYLGPEFVWRGMARDELIDNLRGGTFFWRDGRAQLSRLDVVVTPGGQEATTSGDYLISFRRTGDAPMESHGGAFELRWRKLAGRWQVVAADRIEIPR